MSQQPWWLLGIVISTLCFGEAARDPGVRGGEPGAGNILSGFSLIESVILLRGRTEFTRNHDVRSGLGPSFNGVSCVSCHSQPAAGGSSPFVNPQVAIASFAGATNLIPSFISIGGPVRVARFRFHGDGQGGLSSIRDGGVHALFTIAGRGDSGSCRMAQPNFVEQQRLGNLTFRIPTPVFGVGLIEAIPDSMLVAGHELSAPDRNRLAIQGRPNRSGNDGTITRFGWKAQNKSIEIFSGEAFNVEMGVTNALFPQERTELTSCQLNRVPEDAPNLQAVIKLRAMSQTEKMAIWMRALRPPKPLQLNASRASGFRLFQSVGCANCHTPGFSVASSSQPEIARLGVAMPFSDFYLHRMGPALADEIVQGGAGPDEFRSAPLWGVGQRIFFLHDGRTNDIQEAILMHASPGNEKYPPSEANAVIENYRRLSETEKQDVLNFLRGL